MWYWHNSYLTSPAAVTYSEGIIDQAAAVGYTGMVLWDSAINGLNVPGWNNSYLQQVAAYAASKGLKIVPYVAPFGDSTDILNQNPDLAEGLPVTGAKFTASQDGKTLVLQNSSPG